MPIKTFRARSVGEALALVKRDMGGEAVILHTRTVRSGGFMGVGGRNVTEITATDQNTNSPRARPARRGAAGDNHPEHDPANHRQNDGGPQHRSYDSVGDEERRQRLLALARSRGVGSASRYEQDANNRSGSGKSPETNAATYSRPSPRHAAPSPAAVGEASLVSPGRLAAPAGVRANDDGPHAVPIDDTKAMLAAARDLARRVVGDAGTTAGSPLELTAVDERLGESDAQTTTPRSAGVSDHRSEPPGSDVRRVQPTSSARREAPDPSSIASPSPSRSRTETPGDTAGGVASTTGDSVAPPALHAELAAIERLVREVLHTQRRQSVSTMPEALVGFYEALISQQVDDELAERLIASVCDGLDQDERADTDRVRRAVLSEVSKRVPTMRTLPSGGPQSDGRPLTIALIGPTGVGKTTTVAKVAAAYKLRFGYRVGLITCDTYRIAAVDQLRQYANIIGLPLEVAITPADVERACCQLGDCDVILIDTAGRSQRDACKIVELRTMLEAARPHQRHLVLSTAAGARVLAEAVERFRETDPDHVAFTKVDEAVGLGPVLGVVEQLGRPVSFVTTGQEVPDEIELARADRIAEWLLDGVNA